MASQLRCRALCARRWGYQLRSRPPKPRMLPSAQI